MSPPLSSPPRGSGWTCALHLIYQRQVPFRLRMSKRRAASRFFSIGLKSLMVLGLFVYSLGPAFCFDCFTGACDSMEPAKTSCCSEEANTETCCDPVFDSSSDEPAQIQHVRSDHLQLEADLPAGRITVQKTPKTTQIDIQGESQRGPPQPLLEGRFLRGPPVACV